MISVRVVRTPLSMPDGEWQDQTDFQFWRPPSGWCDDWPTTNLYTMTLYVRRQHDNDTGVYSD